MAFSGFGNGRFILPFVLLAMMLAPQHLLAQEDGDKPDFPSLESVTKGYTKISAPNGEKSFYTLWYREKDQQLLAELPKDFAKQRHFIALTVASGSVFAGLQTGLGSTPC